jgi:DNA polymerase kappa
MQTYLGLGRTTVQPAEEYERKSVGTESTFRDISSKQELREKLRHTAEELEKDMARVAVKGRTLVLKIKLHTYEVFTRQIAPPKAVCLAEDLYNYSLPMLSKLEKELPEFRLRLMGLRCTHLVSTKKTATDFFRRTPGIANENKATGEDEWEVWPDSEFEEAARQERQDDIDELRRLSQEQDREHDTDRTCSNDDTMAREIWTSTADFHEPFGKYKYGSESPQKSKHGHVPNTGTAKPPKPEEQQLWDCPICQLPQPASDKEFNDHIDLCLSRQTIKEAVKEAEATPPPPPTFYKAASLDSSGRASPEPLSVRSKTASGSNKRKSSLRNDNEAPNGRRQKKLFFS